MGKLECIIGCAVSNAEKEPDIWDDVIKERTYRADILRNARHFEQMDSLSGGVQINNQLSVVGDSFLFEHLSDIRYVTHRGQRWTCTVEENYPRVTLTLGGLYNGPSPRNEQLAQTEDGC